MTISPAEAGDHGRLREHGSDDRVIPQSILLAASFNCISRVAGALDVGRD